ncbi:MAG: lytic transglycosylase domain-containing protein [Sphingomonas sp.]|uniref:lytic transglycosylase domain-containing protein n=1 Tax=Sphingomonas sp. TaxID=28214 RepID=UPI00179A6658|nr:lytic transglycosylase domain-containing protein [Sphingomonas sp.]MBA3666137.1 lytic transglycosylase domain-containing protein [Sphingomonas sp.]
MKSSMRRIGIFIPLFLATSASAAVQQWTPAAPPSYAAQPSVQPAYSDVGYALNDWRRLRQSEGYAFADYARFVTAYPGWPGESGLRKSAEKAMRPGENPQTVIAFYRTSKPATGNGWARLAESYAASSRQTEALAAARSAWASGDLSAYDEAALFSRFGSQFTPQDHDKRVDALLFAKKATDAQRMMPWSSGARRPSLSARIAMQTRSPEGNALYNTVASQVATDAGLLMDRARYLNDYGSDSAARQLFARPHSFVEQPASPERFVEMLLVLTRSAMADRQYQAAYDIARQVDDAFAPGTDISAQSYSLRDNYTSLTWTAGLIAYERLGRYGDAMVLFDKYARGGKSLQVATKGWYWAGRAALQARNLGAANSHFEQAARTPELFYGQLALERLGRTVPTPPGMPSSQVTDVQRQAFQRKSMVRAIRTLGSQGRRDEQTLFVRALAEALDNDGDRLLATELAPNVYRQDLAVWTARAARNNGSAFYYKSAFPTHVGYAGSGRLWSLVNGITRQESSFDRAAISGAGARGLMQLMPGTAREQADKMGIGYDYARLTTEPSYNVMLGSAYFQRLLNNWDGSYPLAVASYNAGSGNVRKWINAYGDPRTSSIDMITWIERIPFTETRGYVQRVLENSVVYDRLNPSLPGPQPVHISAYLGKTSRPG